MYNAYATPFLSLLLAMFSLCGQSQPLTTRPNHPVTSVSQNMAMHNPNDLYRVTNTEKSTTAINTGQIAQASETEQQKKELIAAYSHKANLVINHYVRSQQALYQEKHQMALLEINSALELIENADLLAFKGAVYYGMKQHEAATSTFVRAFSLDKNLPVPQVQGLHRWLTDKNMIP